MATFPPLILRGNLGIGTAYGSETDVSDQVTRFLVRAKRDTVDIPATLAGPKSFRAGGASYELELSWLSNDEDFTTYLGGILWTAIASASGLLVFHGSMTDAAVSATNPLWAGEFVAVESTFGGDAETLMTGSATFPMTGAPQHYSNVGS